MTYLNDFWKAFCKELSVSIIVSIMSLVIVSLLSLCVPLLRETKIPLYTIILAFISGVIISTVYYSWRIRKIYKSREITPKVGTGKVS
jgi:Na+-driven multidrug efflux pump